MNPSRRSLLSAIGGVLSVGLGVGSSVKAADSVLMLRFRPFEEAVREAFSSHGQTPTDDSTGQVQSLPFRRVEIGDSELVRAGLQGCHNDRPFAGFPAGHLRIIRTGSQPGPAWRGVRLYVSTVDVALTGGLSHEGPSRAFDFASVPAAPTFS